MEKWEQGLLDDLERAERSQQEEGNWSHSNKGADWEKTCKAFSEDELTKAKRN